MQIGRNLRTLRANKGYTQKKVADLLGISQTTYSRLENNEGRPDLELIQKIALIYEVDVFEILKEEGISFSNKNNKGGFNGCYYVVNSFPEKLIEQYEERINELKNIIENLNQTIKDLK